MTAPSGRVAWEGGEVDDFNGFNANSFAGQMLSQARTPVTFFFLRNWTSKRNDFLQVEAQFFAVIARSLAAVG